MVLPIDHPEYQYPVSRNPYANLREGEGLYANEKTQQHAGHWRQVLGLESHARLTVEVGCNAGHVLLAWAQRSPQEGWIGLEGKWKAVSRAVHQAQKRALKNVVFLRAYAQRLAFMFAPEEISQMCIFFPDPWPRRKQWKHRWIQAERLAQIRCLLQPQGTLWIKTDHRGYFEWILKSVGKGWEPVSCSWDLYADHPHPEKLRIPEVTLFERLFLLEKKPIHELILRRST